MRAWSKQGFLNDASSEDSGWYKFAVKRSSGRRNLAIEVTYYIADCSRKIALNFEPDHVYLNQQGLLDGPDEARVARETRKDIVKKRKKIRAFADAVVLSVEKLEEAYDYYDARLAEALDEYDHRE